MSDDKGAQQSTPTQTAAADEGDTGSMGAKTPEDFSKVLSELSAENKKYRQTYAQYKQELADTQAQLRAMQEAGMAEQGKFKDLYEKSSKELMTERDQRQKDRAQWTGTVVASRFASEAVKAGCQDPMSLIKIAKSDGLLDSPDLISDDTFEVNNEALSSIVQRTKKDYQILFGKATPSPKDGVPKTNNAVGATKNELGKLNMDQLIELAKQQ